MMKRRINYLPCQQPPHLLVPPYVGNDLDVEKVFGIGDANKDRRSNDSKEEALRDRRSGKARGKHDWRSGAATCSYGRSRDPMGLIMIGTPGEGHVRLATFAKYLHEGSS